MDDLVQAPLNSQIPVTFPEIEENEIAFGKLRQTVPTDLPPGKRMATTTEKHPVCNIPDVYYSLEPCSEYLESKPSPQLPMIESEVKRNWGVPSAARSAWQKLDLDLTLFILAVLCYLLTRFIGLADFPIFFFCDEAVQTVLAADLVRDGFYNVSTEFLPTFFFNAYQYNLGPSVYLQVIPFLLLGKSV
jgi:hypothetical protein